LLDSNYASQDSHENRLTDRQEQMAAEDNLGQDFHLVWWPVDPMPHYVRQLVTGYIRKLAQANACVIHKLNVTSRGIHIFVTCPPNRLSCWAADLFKKGVQDEIRARFGYSIKLWQKGYFAADAEQPPTESELKFVLDPLKSTFAGA
jgi:REP element-mobilizing transposase RayT